MKKAIQILFSALFSMMLFACSNDNRIMLFNGENLDNWNVFVGTPGPDPGALFWVEEGMIHTSGKPNGYIRTRETYSNYKLHVEWRWTGEPTNSGVLLHVNGEDRIWPLSIECQLMHQHAGDLVLIGIGSGITVRDSVFLVTSEEEGYKVIGKNEPSSENPSGEWNSYDITSRGGDLEVLVNGVLQHTGTGMTLTEGNILLQSEGSPMQFRNIYLVPLQ